MFLVTQIYAFSNFNARNKTSQREFLRFQHFNIQYVSKSADVAADFKLHSGVPSSISLSFFMRKRPK